MQESTPQNKCSGATGDMGLECRACGVVCERVVAPVGCLRSQCRYVYSFEEGSVTYFGCVEKVFSAELDLAPYSRAPSRDAYGALKARRPPRPECRAHVEQAYQFRYTWQGCRNPLFLQSPSSWTPDAVRRLVEGGTAPGT